MPSPLLTIVIPSFNRAKHLDLLLTALEREMRGLEERVLVIVSDNASPDDTPAVTARFLAACPTAIIVRHSHNIGGDENFCTCVAQVHSRYFWMLGDDDMPRAGVLRRVLALLEQEPVDLLYLHSEWMRDISKVEYTAELNDLGLCTVSRTDFARQVHVWFTFISSMVINRERLYELNPGLDVNRYLGTNMVQLGWILPLLMAGDQFRIAAQPCVLATSGNTGGYRPCTVFGTNFPAVVRQICQQDSPESQQILTGLAWDYLPKLLWATRFRIPEAFLEENALLCLAPLKNSLAYWLVFVPVAKLPRLLAAPFLLLSMAVARGRRALH